VNGSLKAQPGFDARTHQRLLVHAVFRKQVALLAMLSPLAKAVSLMQQMVLMVASSVSLPAQSPVPVEAVRLTPKDAGNWPLAGGVHVTVTSPEVLTAGRKQDTQSKQASKHALSTGKAVCVFWQPGVVSSVLLQQ
jgi:hypothetical protein